MMSRTFRSGAALVMALVILAALLLLGLPFLFSQTASVAGTRAAGYGAAAGRGRASAEQFAVAAAAFAVEPHLTGSSEHSALGPDLTDAGYVAVQDAALKRQDFKDIVAAAPTPGMSTTLGVSIEDDQGKLNPNELSAEAWTSLVDGLEIYDVKQQKWTWTWTAANNGTAPDGVAPYGHWDDDQVGQLAAGLAEFRLSLPMAPTGYRVVEIEQLLQAKPIIWNRTWNPRTGDPADAVQHVSGDGPRRTDPLKRAELERLRPYLSLQLLGQGRQGRTDLGTVIWTDGSLIAPDCGDSQNLVKVGTWLVFGNDNRPGIIFSPNGGGRLELHQAGAQPVADDALGLTIPPVLNLHAATDKSRLAAGVVTDPSPPLKDLTDLAKASLPDYQRVSPLASSAERPAVGLASTGVVTVESAATTADPQQVPQASHTRRVVVQAVPQEQPVVAQWTTQDRLHALLESRLGSRLDSWPYGYRRLTTVATEPRTLPSIDAAPVGVPPGEDDGAIGVRPAVMRTLATASHLFLDWRLPLGQGTPVAAAKILDDLSGQVPQVPAAGALSAYTPDANRLQPDGYRLNSNGDPVLAYQLNGVKGPLTQIDATTELGARSLACWMRFPKTAPADGTVIFEARAPVANLGQPVNVGDAPSAENQNLWRLIYKQSGSDGQLILRIANQSIEHPSDYILPSTFALRFPVDDPTTWDLDERCLGTVDDLPGAPLDPVTAVVFKYFIKGGLKADRWYHLQIAAGNDRPGGAAIILDGIVGTDVLAKAVGGSSVLANTGDHYDFPCMRLATEIPKVDVASGADLVPAGGVIDVVLPPGLNITDILPSRGLVRIDDEYFSYGKATSTDQTGKLEQVIRARRVNTNQGDPDVDKVWPVTQKHMLGALVVPGGLQYSIDSGHFYRGATTLAQPLTNGDENTFFTTPSPGNGGLLSTTYDPPDAFGLQPHPRWNRWRTWAWVDPTCAVASAGLAELSSAVTTVTLQTGKVHGTFPPRGFARCYIVQGGNAFGSPTAFTNEFYYEGGTATTMPVTAWISNLMPAFDPTTDAVLVVLTSIEVTDDISDDLQFPHGAVFPNSPAFQVMDVNGRMEWIAYQRKAQAPLAATVRPWFFIDDHGFPFLNANPLGSPRGHERTSFGGDTYRNSSAASSGSALPAFPALSSVLPVQSNNLGSSDNFEDGDVVTLVPSAVDLAAGKRPKQLVIRHAASDGFPNPTAAPTDVASYRWDTHNEWFSFCQKVPDEVPDTAGGPVSVLIGRAWNGDDLSTVGNSVRRRGRLPRITAWQTNFSDPDARFTIVAPDAGRGGAGTPPEVVVDGLAAGSLGGFSDLNSSEGCGVTDLGGLSVMTDAINQLPLPNVIASRAVFNLDFGLVLLDGEVFAYKRTDPDNSFKAELIGRGLLGSARVAHRLPAEADRSTVPGRTILPQLTLLPLPIGPVGRVDKWMAGTPDRYTFEVGNPANPPIPINAPITVLMQAAPEDPKAPGFEVVGYASDGNERLTRSWLRGQYGTTVVDWAVPQTGAPNLKPLAIGWWPRYPSALPMNPATEHFRCRQYSWASFPLRMHQMRFDASPAATVPVVTDGGFYLQVRAMSQGNNWTSVTPASPAAASTVFTGSQFSKDGKALEVDGAELRVTWQYTQATTTLEQFATAGNTAPMLGKVEMRCHAPCAVLAVEGAK